MAPLNNSWRGAAIPEPPSAAFSSVRPMQYAQTSADYALKLHHAGGRPAWRTKLSLAEALALSNEAIAAEELAAEPRYLTATIYRDAMVVTMCRYFPIHMRVKKNTFQPRDED